MTAKLKKLLPVRGINILRSIHNAAGLVALKPGKFDASGLASVSYISLENIWHDEKATRHWPEDHGSIAEAYGNIDRYGGVNPGDRKALYHLVHFLQPKKVLETGTHIGASTLHIAAALKRSGKKPYVQTVDILDVNDPQGAWKKLGLSNKPSDYAKRLELSELIQFHTSDSCHFMRKSMDKFDLVFLDGDHAAASVYREVECALELLNPNGLILLHDYYPGGCPIFPDGQVIPGPFQALERIRKESPDITVLPLGELPWPTKQNSRMTSLALIARR